MLIKTQLQQHKQIRVYFCHMRSPGWERGNGSCWLWFSSSMTSKQNFYETTGSWCQDGHATPETLSAFQDTGKSCQEENHTLLHWVSSLGRSLLGSLPVGPPQLHLNETHRASKNTRKRSVLFKTDPKHNQETRGKENTLLWGQFAFLTTQTRFNLLLSDCSHWPLQSLLTELM